MNLKILKDTFTITALKSIPDLKRQPLIIFLIGMISSLPLYFLVIFGEQITLGLIGAMVSTVSFIGMNAAIQEMSWDRYVKIREMIVAMPVHPISYALGIALAPLILSIPSLIFFGTIALWLDALTLQSLLWTVIALILCWATVSSAGFLISTYLQKASTYTLNNLSNILGIALGFIPPVYYPEEILGNFSWISIIFPTSNAASLIRVYSGSLILPFEMVVVRWLVLIATTIVFAVITAAKARWREI
ncbi:MAG: ABC transporter permease [Candidatus Bathyarchaeota archaeon]|nr:ABC transporter permease [Candidatus Bathyarchaeota archaeon]